MTVFIIWLIFRDDSSTLRVNSETLTISEVTSGEFNDYIRINGLVHLYHGVAEGILLFSKVRLRVKYLKIEIIIAQAKDDISRFHLTSFFENDIFYDAGFTRADLYCGHRMDQAVDADVVVEFTGGYFADSQSL